MDQDASHATTLAYYHMLGLSTYAPDEEVREGCVDFASLAGAVSGAQESLVKQRVVDIRFGYLVLFADAPRRLRK